MSQERNRQSSYKRSRSARNRPTVVNTTSSTSETAVQNAQSDVASQEPDINASSIEGIGTTPAVPAPRTRRLPQFFSSVSKGETAQESNTISARFARFTRSKASSSTEGSSVAAPSNDKKSEAKSTSPAPARSTSSRSTLARRNSGFKLRYIYGVILYLVAADFLGLFEGNYLRANKLDSHLFSVGPYPITVSTILYLATLVIVLVVLAYFDLIPRTFGAMSGSPSAQGKSGKASGTTDTVKQRPPTMKQGVQGEDDDLYQEYRAQQRYNQRRSRKR